MNQYTQNAISVLQQMQAELEPALMAYWVAPNTILTLSGARAFSDNVYWSDNDELLEKWKHEIEQSLLVLKKYADVSWSDAKVEEIRPGEKCTAYEVLLRPGLGRVLHETKIIPNGADLIREETDMNRLMEDLKSGIKSQPKYSDVSKEDLSHIAFGILVGYPDDAIIGTILEEDHRKNPFAERTINADIRGADYYVCPQPVYDYPRHLVTDPVITAHEQLWSTILREYYESDFHLQLEADTAFQAKLAELEMLW